MALALGIVGRDHKEGPFQSLQLLLTVDRHAHIPMAALKLGVATMVRAPSIVLVVGVGIAHALAVVVLAHE